MKNSKKLKNIDWLRRLQDEGKPTPILDKEVKLFPDLVWVWKAFDTLSEKRYTNQSGPQPIAMTDILSYAEYYGIRGQIRRENFLRFISLMDRVTLEHRYDEMDKARKAQERKAKQDARTK